MPYKLVYKRGCGGQKGARKDTTRLCTRVFNSELKKYYSKQYMQYDKAARQLGYLRAFAQKNGYKH